MHAQPESTPAPAGDFRVELLELMRRHGVLADVVSIKTSDDTHDILVTDDRAVILRMNDFSLLQLAGTEDADA
jgi:hypothetical protein